MDEDEEELEFDEDYQDEEEEDDDEDEGELAGGHQVLALMGNIFRAQLRFRPQQPSARKRRQRPGQENLEPVPSEEGRELMWGGEFGQVCLLTISLSRRQC